MIAVENGHERKKIVDILYEGFERYVSVCNYNMYFYIGVDTQMQTVLWLVNTKSQ